MVFAAMVALVFAAETAATPPPVLKSTDLSTRPNGPDYARAFPIGAQKRNVEGDVDIWCHVTNAGGLVDCQVIKEDPPGFQFGPAALQLMPLFKLNADATARQAGGMVSLRILFHLPRDPGTARMKPISVRAQAAGAGHVDVSCQVFTGRFGNCFVVKTTSPALESDALAAATNFNTGALPLGLRLVMPIDFVVVAPGG